MDEVEGQVKRLEELVNTLQRYIQKQEKMLLDHLRRNIEYELKTEDLSRAVNELSSKYEESQKQVEIQNDLMQQAANGVETLTIENKKQETYLNTMRKSLEDKDKRLVDYKNENDKLKEKLESVEHIYGEMKQEYSRQTEELNIIFKENEELKKGKAQIKPNPKKPVDEF
jgi:chromosome segregation ATPase